MVLRPTLGAAATAYRGRCGSRGAALDGQPCVSIEELWATSGEVEEAAAPSDEREPSDFLRSLAARPITKSASDAAAMAAYEAYVDAQLAKADSEF